MKPLNLFEKARCAALNPLSLILHGLELYEDPARIGTIYEFLHLEPPLFLGNSTA